MKRVKPPHISFLRKKIPQLFIKYDTQNTLYRNTSYWNQGKKKKIKNSSICMSASSKHNFNVTLLFFCILQNAKETHFSRFSFFSPNEIWNQIKVSFVSSYVEDLKIVYSTLLIAVFLVRNLLKCSAYHQIKDCHIWISIQPVV